MPDFIQLIILNNVYIHKKGEADDRENLQTGKCDVTQMFYYKISSSENLMAKPVIQVINDILQTMKSGQILHHCQ